MAWWRGQRYARTVYTARVCDAISVWPVLKKTRGPWTWLSKASDQFKRKVFPLYQDLNWISLNIHFCYISTIHQLFMFSYAPFVFNSKSYDFVFVVLETCQGHKTYMISPYSWRHTKVQPAKITDLPSPRSILILGPTFNTIAPVKSASNVVRLISLGPALVHWEHLQLHPWLR